MLNNITPKPIWAAIRRLKTQINSHLKIKIDLQVFKIWVKLDSQGYNFKVDKCHHRCLLNKFKCSNSFNNISNTFIIKEDQVDKSPLPKISKWTLKEDKLLQVELVGLMELEMVTKVSNRTKDISSKDSRRTLCLFIKIQELWISRCNSHINREQVEEIMHGQL